MVRTNAASNANVNPFFDVPQDWHLSRTNIKKAWADPHPGLVWKDVDSLWPWTCSLCKSCHLTTKSKQLVFIFLVSSSSFVHFKFHFMPLDPFYGWHKGPFKSSQLKKNESCFVKSLLVWRQTGSLTHTQHLWTPSGDTNTLTHIFWHFCHVFFSNPWTINGK